jgi:hypothetical protein
VPKDAYALMMMEGGRSPDGNRYVGESKDAADG